MCKPCQDGRAFAVLENMGRTWQVGRKIVGQHTPGAATPENLENGVDNTSHVHTSATATSFGRWNEWFQDEPLDIVQIADERGCCFRHLPGYIGVQVQGV
jgi:hypothetical protein